MSAKDIGQLKELVSILAPFAEATDFTQGDRSVTVSCVVPVLSLKTKLEASLNSPGSFSSLVKTLLHSLHVRFAGIFQLLDVKGPPELRQHTNRLRFDSSLFLMAPALDPAYAYHWLQDYPGNEEQKEAIRCKING